MTETKIREEVTAFAALCPLPNSGSASIEQVSQIETALHRIDGPISHAEAMVLARCFGNDDLFGLAWTLLHLIETAPLPLDLDSLQNDNNEWISLMRRRAQNAKR
jgi:hypothetical protein